MQTTFHPGPDWAPPSFPPVDAAIARARSIDWAAFVHRLAIAAAFSILFIGRAAALLINHYGASRVMPEPAVKLDALTVTELRSLARCELGSSARIGGRRIAQARKADLIQVLGG
jgi:hypothetical protein